MTTLLQLITEALRPFFEIIPRVKKICADEKGVKFCLGNKVKVLNPGVHLFIPIFHKIKKIAITRRSMGLKKQSLITKDGKQIMVESSCFYKIIDIKKALVENNDVRDILEDIVLSNIKFFVINNTFQFLVDNIDKIEKDILKKGIHEEKTTGVKMQAVRITDLAKCIHFNNIQNITYNKGSWV